MNYDDAIEVGPHALVGWRTVAVDLRGRTYYEVAHELDFENAVRVALPVRSIERIHPYAAGQQDPHYPVHPSFFAVDYKKATVYHCDMDRAAWAVWSWEVVYHGMKSLCEDASFLPLWLAYRDRT